MLSERLGATMEGVEMTVESGVRTLNLGRQTTEAKVQTAATLSVVIPALNEENGIADIIQRVHAVEAALRDEGVEALELIVVDDGSRDRTAEIAASFPFVHLLRWEPSWTAQ